MSDMMVYSNDKLEAEIKEKQEELRRRREAESDKHRLARLCVDAKYLMDFLCGEPYDVFALKHFPELPKGYEIRGVHADFMNQHEIQFLIWHPSFPVVRPGEHTPRFAAEGVIGDTCHIYRRV